ncbi:hypothetical protein Ciccas_007512 [Cichlidogyrus casuarinus]|uniref:NUP160 middle TPR domain-containing protein n=1 Tax=Cichlidogyrus casuarinus TaxID=1844966 RepID=A0ABD2Q3C0_9PLAT
MLPLRPGDETLAPRGLVINEGVSVMEHLIATNALQIELPDTFHSQLDHVEFAQLASNRLLDLLSPAVDRRSRVVFMLRILLLGAKYSSIEQLSFRLLGDFVPKNVPTAILSLVNPDMVTQCFNSDVLDQSDTQWGTEFDRAALFVAMGLSYLWHEDLDKAISNLILGSSCIPSEENEQRFRASILFQLFPRAFQTQSFAQIRFLFKVVNVFELLDRREEAIRLSDACIELIQQMHDSVDSCELQNLKSVFWTALFKNELHLGNSHKAQLLVQCHPDAKQQRECLRQLVKVLCDRKEMKALQNYDYEHLEDEFLGIIEARARVCDVVHYQQLTTQGKRQHQLDHAGSHFEPLPVRLIIKHCQIMNNLSHSEKWGINI